MHATLDAPHVRDVIKGPKLMSAVRKVGAFVLNEGLGGTIAVTTLHSHFSVPTGKALLDRVNVVDGVITTGLVPTAQAIRHQAAVWGFTPDGIRVPLGWSDDAHVDDQLMPAVDKVGAFLVCEKLTIILAVVPRRTPNPGGAG
jgi:hypothetical protein